MAREKAYETPAERQAAYRERKRLESLGLTVPADIAVGAALADLAGEGDELPVKLPEIPVGRPAPPLEEYVAEAIRGAHLVADEKERRHPPESQAERKDYEDARGFRVKKAEEYARWRHAGYVAGEVGSL